MRKHYSSSQLILYGFIGVILTGALLLCLPFASRVPGRAPFADALFTAVSATCVTGLVVQDTATYWTEFGQFIILILIQIGGLGVLTVSAALAMVGHKQIGLLQRSTMQDAISAHQMGGIVKFTIFILKGVFLMELGGAILLLPRFITDFGPLKGIWYAIFHSVSAFCNAGFDLMGVRSHFSSMTSYANDAWVVTVLCFLITIGGIGFLTWEDIKTYKFKFRSYRMQSKVILIVSLVLTCVPALIFYIEEFKDVEGTKRVLDAVFQSVTLRTAGFNTVDFNEMSPRAIALMIPLMLVGGSPGSTAGGLKTTTLAVLAASCVAVFRRREHTNLFGRRVTEDTVRNASAILIMYLSLFFTAALLISRIDDLPLMECLFETASAVGTVGVTMGITPGLSQASRIILMILMFCGRVGGLTVIFATVAGGKNTRKSMYPKGKITVG